MPLHRFVPWFIVGFLALALLRAVGLAPPPAVDVARSTAGWLTILAMAALGLGVDCARSAESARG